MNRTSGLRANPPTTEGSRDVGGGLVSTAGDYSRFNTSGATEPGDTGRCRTNPSIP